MSTLKYGLNVPKKSQKPTPKKALFDDEEEISKPPTDSSARANTLKPPSRPSRNKGKVEEIDPSIYDYDAAYDAMHAKSAAKIAAEKEDARERKPRYMKNLIAAAEVRERDQLRAKDKLLQKEREAEGDEFADKEKFVTGAYKEQQEQMRKLEEEEKRKEEEEARKKRAQGMSGFYRTMMDRDEQRHQESMEAVAKAGDGSTIPAKETAKEKSEADVAKEMNMKGGNVIINEEGQVADKRQLLTAGLNVTARPKPKDTSSSSTNIARNGPIYKGRTEQQRAVRERQSRMLEEQLEQATKRAADDEAEEQRKQEHAAKSRKTKEDIEAVKARFQKRKQEMAAAKKGS